MIASTVRRKTAMNKITRSRDIRLYTSASVLGAMGTIVMAGLLTLGIVPPELWRARLFGLAWGCFALAFSSWVVGEEDGGAS